MKTNGSRGPNASIKALTITMPMPTATTARSAELCPTVRHREADSAVRPRYLREHEAYLGLRPALISEISGDVRAETCQRGGEEKIDAVKTLKAPIGSRNVRGPSEPVVTDISPASPPNGFEI